MRDETPLAECHEPGVESESNLVNVMVEAAVFRVRHRLAEADGPDDVVEMSGVGAAYDLRHGYVVIRRDAPDDLAHWEALPEDQVAKDERHQARRPTGPEQTRELPVVPQHELRVVWPGELRSGRDGPPVRRQPQLVHQLEGARVARVKELRADIDQVSAPFEKLHPPSRTVRSFQNLDLVAALGEPMGGGQPADARADDDDAFAWTPQALLLAVDRAQPLARRTFRSILRSTAISLPIRSLAPTQRNGSGGHLRTRRRTAASSRCSRPRIRSASTAPIRVPWDSP